MGEGDAVGLLPYLDMALARELGVMFLNRTGLTRASFVRAESVL